MELYRKFQPLFIFSNVCGLGPYAVFRNGKLQFDRKLFIWSFVVLGILCGMQLLVLLDFSGTGKLANSRAADLIDTYGFLTTCLGGFLAHFVLSNELLSLWNRVLKIHPKTSMTSTHILIDILGGFVYEITFAVVSIFMEPAKYSNFFYYFLETFTYVALEVTNFVIFLQFNHLVLTCWRSFNALNGKLRKLLVRVQFQPNHDHSQARSRFLLKKLSAEHAEIVSVCSMINKLFAVQNLLSVTLIFIELTYAFYNGIFNWEQDLSRAVLTDTVLWAGYFLYKLLMMLTACSLTTFACKETETLLQKLTYKVDDTAFGIEVEYFTLQLLHATTRFDAHGFFPLDFTLIYSVSVFWSYVIEMGIYVTHWCQMISSVAGYLVILVQFSSFNFRSGIDLTKNHHE